MAQQGMPHHGGYTVAEPSQYDPYNIAGGYSPYSGGMQDVMPSQQHAPNQNPYLYQAEPVQHASHPMPYGSDYAQTVYHQPANNFPMGAQGSVEQPGGHYAPFGAVPQNDPYAAYQHQQPALPSGFVHEQSAPAPQQQFHQPPISGGYNYNSY
jgi:hypothetical protein